MMKTLKILLGGVFAIWIISAFVMYFYYLISDKQRCIEEEEFWKGWLWCEPKPLAIGSAAAEEVSLLFRSVIWPIHFFSDANGRSIPTVKGANVVSEKTENIGKIIQACSHPAWEKELNWALDSRNSGVKLEEGLALMKSDLYANPQAKNYASKMIDQMYMFKKMAWETVYTNEDASKPEIKQLFTNHCIRELSTAIEGTSSHKVAYCKREADSILRFGRARDEGATLAQAKASLRRHAPELKEKMESAFGVSISLEEVIREQDNILEYVFKNKTLSPQKLAEIQYSSCIEK